MDELQTETREALRKATEFSFSCQRPDGHWVAPVYCDAGFTAQYVMFRYALPGLTIGDDADDIKRWFLNTQDPLNGSWSLAPGLEGDLSISIEIYLALRLLGTSASEPSMQLARDFIITKDGIAKARFLTRVFLAFFGLFPWDAMPQIPVELILVPSWAPLNIYTVSSWARSTLVPLLLIFHHRPVYPLPQDSDRRGSEYLDELWIDPSNKHVPSARLSDALYGCDLLKATFVLGDKVIAGLGGLRKGPQRHFAIRRCIAWIIQHQETTGETAGFLAPIYFGILALHLEGYSIHCDYIQRGLGAMERLIVTESRGKWISTTDSPVWDTALMVKGVLDAGVDKQDPRITSAVQWLKARELSGPEGDWRIYSPNRQPGAWSFEYNNTWYPDVDDTTAIVIMLVEQDSSAITSDSVAAAVNWILGMQNHDGGWAAFDTNNDAKYFRSVPFNDMDNFSDPSSADITGRVVECCGILLRTRSKGHGIDRHLDRRLRIAAEKGVRYLLKEQKAQGSWYGRWACNHFYGTGNVIRGLAEFCAQGEPKEIHQAILRGLQWIEAHQNEDGGWGEEFSSYFEDAMVGVGQSTAAQTAWALDTLLRFRSPSHKAVMAGVRWLVTNQNPEEKMGSDFSSWPSAKYVGVGFPGSVLLGYPMFHHHFAMSALGRFLSSCKHELLLANRNNFKVYAPTADVISALSRRDVLLIPPESRSEIDIFFRIAMKLHQKDHRVRIATNPHHRQLVEEHGFEFYHLSGHSSQSEFADSPNRSFAMVLQSILRAEIRHCLFDRMHAPWMAGFDSSRQITEKNPRSRPFVADAIVAMPSAAVHVYAAKRLHVPLVVVAPKPPLDDGESSQPFIKGGSNGYAARLRNYIFSIHLYIINWLALSSCIKDFGARYHHISTYWTWPISSYLHNNSPRVEVHHVASEDDGSDIAANMVEFQLEPNRQNGSQCALVPEIQAQWRHIGLDVYLSGAVASSLAESGKLCRDDLVPLTWVHRKAKQQSSWATVLICMASRVMRLFSILPVMTTLLIKLRVLIHAYQSPENAAWLARMQKSRFEFQIMKESADKNGVDLDKHFADCWDAILFSKRRQEFNR